MLISLGYYRLVSLIVRRTLGVSQGFFVFVPMRITCETISTWKTAQITGKNDAKQYQNWAGLHFLTDHDAKQISESANCKSLEKII